MSKDASPGSLASEESEIPKQYIRKDYAVGGDPLLERRVRSGEVVIAQLGVFKRWSISLSFGRSALFPCNVVINTREGRGEAMHNDVVAIELLPREQWQRKQPTTNDAEADKSVSEPSGRQQMLPDGRVIRRCVRQKGPDEPGQQSGEALMEVYLAEKLGAPKPEWGAGLQPVGKVICVLHRRLEAFQVGSLAPGAWVPGTPIQCNNYYRFKPYNPLMPQLAVRGADIPAQFADDFDQYLFILKVSSTVSGDLERALGNICRATIHCSLGRADTVDANNRAISCIHEIRSETFPDDVEACVPRDFVIPDADELARTGRRDLRAEEFICTIDPASARDLDDALSCRATAGGGYHVGVHIADVSHFVPVGCAMDMEARERCTSTYFVDKVVPMLPRKLSEDYCSLNPSEDKFAFSALFEMDHDGNVVSEWFGKSVIRSRCRLAYEQAQCIVEGDEVGAEIDTSAESQLTGVPVGELQKKVYASIRLLYSVASKRREAALKRGRVVIGNLTLGFDFDRADTHLAPRGFFIQRQINANWLVEELMLLANTRAAEKIVQYLPDEALLRRHLPPSAPKINELKHALNALGVTFKGSSARELQETIDESKCDPALYDRLSCALKYTQHLAQYMPNGANDEDDNRAHFALGFPWYTHFTSPIRRYCDVIVHRQLQIALEVEELIRARGQALPTMSDIANMAGERCFEALDIDPMSLRTKDLYYSLDDVENITARANARSIASRDAGDESRCLFLCLYIMALKRKSLVDRSIPSKLFVGVSVVRLAASEMMLFSRELACEVEVGFRDSQQRYTLLMKQLESEQQGTKTPGKPAESGRPERNLKEEARPHRKGGKVDMRPRDSAANGKRDSGKAEGAPMSLTLSWGAHPDTGEETVEEVRLLSTLAAEVFCTTKDGRLALNMAVLPPWERDKATSKGARVPTSLV